MRCFPAARWPELGVVPGMLPGGCAVSGVGLRLALLAVLGVAVAHGQQYAQLSGLIRDPSDSAVPRAAVILVQDETGFRRMTYSGLDGGYAFAGLLPGVYKITVRKEGFRTLVRFGLKLRVAQAARVDFTLPLGSIQETVTVEGTPPLTHSLDASVGALVGREQIERLPLNGRGLLSLLELAPATIVTPATRGEPGQFTTNGYRPNSHSFTVDGVSLNTGVSGGGSPALVSGGVLPAYTAFGSLHAVVSLEALEEFRVQTATTPAEFGRLAGAHVALSTRTGTNQWHGSLFHYLRHERFDAADWFANRMGLGRAPMRMNDWGGSLGGPLQRNRGFVFASYEMFRLRQPFIWRTATLEVSERDHAQPWASALLSLFPLPNGSTLGSGLAEWTGMHHRPAKFHTANIRSDQALTPRLTAFVRLSASPSSSQFGGPQINELNIRFQTLTAFLNWRPSAGAVLDVRSGWSQVAADSIWSPARGPLGPCEMGSVTEFFIRLPGLCDHLVRLSIAGVGSVVSGREGDRQQSQWHLVSSAAVAYGGHQIRFGADYRRLAPKRRDHSGTLSVMADSLADLKAARNLWIAVAEPLAADTKLDEASAFIQNTWRVHPRLTLNAGMRWEFAPAPRLRGLAEVPFQWSPYRLEEQPRFWRSGYGYFAPRLGIAFRPFALRDTVARVGVGIYYDSSLAIATDLLNGGPFALSQHTSAVHAPFASLLTYGFQPGLRLPRIRQFSAAIDQALSSRDVLTLAYVATQGSRLLRRELGGEQSNQLLRLALATNHGLSAYNGLQVQYRRRMSRRLEAMLAYSWAHSIDNSSSDSALHWIGNPPGAAQDRGPSDFDVRHNFTLAFTYAMPTGRPTWLSRLLGSWALDGIFRARTGFPLNVLQSEFAQGLSYDNAFRPDVIAGAPLWLADASAPSGRRLNPHAFRLTGSGVQGNLGRNAIAGLGMHQWDLAVRREFALSDRLRLQFRLESFNTFNHPNFADPAPFLSSPFFGMSPSMLNQMLGTGSPGSGLTPVLQSGGARSFQLALRLRF